MVFADWADCSNICFNCGSTHCREYVSNLLAAVSWEPIKCLRFWSSSLFSCTVKDLLLKLFANALLSFHGLDKLCSCMGFRTPHFLCSFMGGDNMVIQKDKVYRNTGKWRGQMPGSRRDVFKRSLSLQSAGCRELAGVIAPPALAAINFLIYWFNGVCLRWHNGSTRQHWGR